MNLAVFDIDYTIYKKGSGPEFYKYVARKGWTAVDVEFRHQQMKSKFEARQISYRETVEIAIQLLADVVADKSEGEVDGWLKVFFEEVKLVNEWVQPLFSLLKQRGFEIYLVSASGSPVVKGLAEQTKADGWLASDFEIVEGKYSGKVKHFLHSQEKGELVEELRGKLGAKQVWAFGDSEGDSAMLAAADRAFVYQPWDGDFKKEAEQRGWMVVDEESIVEAVKKTLINLDIKQV